MNGARAVLATLIDAGVDTCFANPGTSEMHLVAALDEVPEMRGVLALFEGVATGAADGYARVTGRPAATLLHLGPGLANGTANLHNAKRAHSPVVNLVGDHATYHKRYDPPLESDVRSLASVVSGWYRSSARADDAGADAADAVAASYGPPGQIATLLLPADTGWSESATGPGRPLAPPRPPLAPHDAVDSAAKRLRSGEPAALYLCGPALRERGLLAASRVARATGAKLLAETFPANLERGAGIPAVERLGYFAELAEAQMTGLRQLVLAGGPPPVSFFAYPGKPSVPLPTDCDASVLATASHDVPAALEALADALGAPGAADLVTAQRPEAPSGELTLQSLAAAVGALLPEDAIVVDESVTGGLFITDATTGAARHDWLTLTGGAIGQGLPVATGAALGAPDRKVLCLQADGSAMYTLQALWTQAREGLDVTTLLLSNRSYEILHLELARVGAAGGGPAAKAMLELSRPDLDFVSLARGMGVPGARARTADELVEHLARSLREPGPALVEAELPGLG